MTGKKKCIADNPALMAEWDFDENDRIGLNPTSLSCSSGKKAWWKCAKCSQKWYSYISNRSKGHGCPFCSGNRIVSTDQYALKVKTINPSISIVGSYTGANRKIRYKCNNCNFESDVYASVLTKSFSCPNCRDLSRCHEELIKLKSMVPHDIEIVGDYKGAHTKIRCHCLVCDSFFEITPCNLKNGQGCRTCAIKSYSDSHRKSREQFIEEIRIINPNIEILGDYKNAHTKLLAKCKRCKNTWEITPNDLLRGNGCPTCSHNSTSYFEKIIYHSFGFFLGYDKVFSRDKKAIGEEIDIFVPSCCLGIEPGSWYWHKNRLSHDYNKYINAKKCGITLIYIYDCFDSTVELPFDSAVIIYKEDLGSKKNDLLLKELVTKLLAYTHTNIDLKENEWSIIKSRAYCDSKKKTTEEFISQLKLVNPTVIVESEYIGALNAMKCRCSVCGNIWETTPSKLLIGQKCRKCSITENASKQTKTTEQFTKELRTINRNITVIGEYYGALKHIRVQCQNCGFVWEPIASNLLRGRKCPNCHNKSPLND